MIITKLQGGLGNQMFQYAIGKHLAIKNNTDLILDITYMNFDKKRKYELHKFNICEKIVDANFSHICNIITESSHCFDQHILNLKDNCYLSGFWQNENYFNDIRPIILNIFKLISYSSKFKYYENMIDDNTISIHIRRGDYISEPHTNSFHGVCSIEYYQKSLEYLNSHINISKILIFSDDVHWVKSSLDLSLYSKQIVIEQLSNEEDMILMSKCHHNIIANSSFSWWGAWLNNNINKIVVAPQKWFNNKEANIKQDIVPNNWIKI